MKVQDAMTRPALTCTTEDTLQTAALGMAEHDYGCVVVVDDERRCIGILTLRDVVIGAAKKRKRLDQLQVADAMTTPGICVAGSELLAHAESIMQTSRVRRLPVRDADGNVIGLLSLDDLSRAAARSKAAGTPIDVSLAGVGATLAMICEPRRMSAVELTKPPGRHTR